MKFQTPTDVKDFDPEQQDTLLAEMQAEAIAMFSVSEKTFADRTAAASLFAEAAKARTALQGAVAGARRNRALNVASMTPTGRPS
jgi:hypothetical protein